MGVGRGKPHRIELAADNMTNIPVGAPRRRRLFGLAFLVVGLMVVSVANLEVTTRQGVNFEVSTHQLPLYVKALEFIDRSVQYQQIADEVTRSAVSDEDRALKVFDWTRRQIRRTPDGWPIVDDHILHIIIRGHGVNDQQADVFATLTTYAGVPAFWGKVGHDRAGVILSFAYIEGQWRVFDVFNGVVFRNPTGGLATMADLKNRPNLVPASMRSGAVEEGVAYRDILTRALMPAVPDPLRAELQMPSTRLWHEMKVALRLELPR